MSALSTALCLKCEKVFDKEQRKMCTGTCNHSMCELCFDNQYSGICPVCNKERSFLIKNINYQAMELLEELMGKITLSELFDEKSEDNCKTQYSGECSECNQFRERLRVCVGCLQDAGLLVRSENGEVKVPEKTISGELLETRILRIKSSAFCADCRIDKGLHEGHEIITIDKIKNLKSIVGTTNILAGLALFLQKIKSRNTVFKDDRTIMSVFDVVMQINKFFETMDSRVDMNLPLDEGFVLYTKLLAKCNNTLNSTLIDSLVEEMEETDNPEERLELQKIINRLEEFRNIASTSSLEPNDITDVMKIWKSGLFQEIKKKWNNDTTIRADMKKSGQNLLNVSNDIKGAIPFKMPQESEKYVKLAEGVLSFFFN